MDFNIIIGWPQGIYLALIIAQLLISAGLHGEPREPVNFIFSLLDVVIILLLLVWGGFFG
jgi:hypothetical protein